MSVTMDGALDPDVYRVNLEIIFDECKSFIRCSNLDVLEKTANKLSLHREFIYGLYIRCLNSNTSNESKRNIERIFEILHGYHDYYERKAQEIRHLQSDEYAYQCQTESNGQVGRPRYDIQSTEIMKLFNIHRNWVQVAHEMGISYSTLLRRRADMNLPISAHGQPQVVYSDISMDNLCALLHDIIKSFPGAGESYIIGALRARQVFVQRQRVRDALQIVDPVSRAIRRTTSLVRRVYSVPCPNALWHADGHHKLIRWRFVIHGAIDGYSRCIVFLQCADNNRASTVLGLFTQAVDRWGLPSRVRCDYGTENYDIAAYMLSHPERGPGRGSFISGRSCHNQRIERLWLEVKEKIVWQYQEFFYQLEDLGYLDPCNEDHLKALHFVYLPRINQSLVQFSDVYNNHPLRTERNKSPLQLYHSGLRRVIHSDLSAVNSVIHGNDYNDFGIDEAGIFPDDSPNDVQVPNICHNQEHVHCHLVPDPLQDDRNNGHNHYKRILGFM